MPADMVRILRFRSQSQNRRLLLAGLAATAVFLGLCTWIVHVTAVTVIGIIIFVSSAAATVYVAPDSDHYCARIALSANLRGVAAAYLTAVGLPESSADYPRSLETATDEGIHFAEGLLASRLMVRKKIMESLDLAVDIVLTFAGALLGGWFVKSLTRGGDPTTVERATALGLALTFVLLAVLLAWKLLNGQAAQQREAAGTFTRFPVEALQGLPFRDSRFREVFRADLADAAVIATLDAAQRAALRRTARLDLRVLGEPLQIATWDIAPEWDFSFKLAMFAVGLVIGIFTV